jgi:hypothetical protein
MALTELFFKAVNPLYLATLSITYAPVWMNLVTVIGELASFVLMGVGISRTMNGYCDYPGVQGMFWGCNWMLLAGIRMFLISLIWAILTMAVALGNKFAEMSRS